MKDAEKEFVDKIKWAIGRNEPAEISEAVSDFSLYGFKDVSTDPEEQFSDDFIDGLKGLMAAGNFLAMEDSYKLAMLFQNDWGRMTPGQQKGICQFLEGIYEEAKDDTLRLVIAELLGEYLADKAGLDALARLASASDEVARAHVAHGFKCLVSNGTEPALRTAARTRLTSMQQDKSQVVRDEVAAALAELA